MSLANLARHIHYSKGYLSKVENGLVRCSPELLALCDKALEADGELIALAHADGRASAPLGINHLAMTYAMAFIVALDEAHQGLREVARAGSCSPGDPMAANNAVHDAGLYLARERLLVSGSVQLVRAGEAAFRCLIAIRDAIRTGARLDTEDYHRTYHRYAEALWSFRMAMRAEFGQPPLSPALLGRIDWSDRERCQSCADTS